MAGVLAGECSYSESGVSSHSRNSHEKQEEVSRWYFGRKEIEENSPSRLDGIDLKKETYLRKSYCTFLQDLGMRLKVPQVTIATAIIFCHRFFFRQSHAKNDRRTIATVCMFLAGKVEETPRPLKDVIFVSYEIINKKDPGASQKIKQKEVYEQHKELILNGEKIVLSTLGFDLNVHHPYKPLVEAIKKFKVAQNALAQVAWNFVNDGLRTSLCLQFKPHHIAAGAIFLAAKFLKVKLPSDGEKVWWQEFDVTPRQLEDVSNQMLELYEQNRVPASQGSEVESSVGGGSAQRPGSRNAVSTDEHVGSRQTSVRSTHEHSNSDNPGSSSKGVLNQNNDNGVGEAVNVSVDNKEVIERETKESSLHSESHTAAHKDSAREAPHNSRPLVQGPGKDNSEREGGELQDDGAVHKSRNVEAGDVPISQSPKDLKLLRDKVKAKREKAKKLLGERTRKKDLMDEDDLIERELEDVELAVEDEKTKERKVQSRPKVENSDTMGTEHGEILDVKGEVKHTEEGEMVNDVSPMMHSRKRKMGSPPEKQTEGKRRHNSENGEEGHNKTSRGSSHHGDREHRRHSQENNHS
ncbi:PREDICTED: cyclin-T1-5-like [Camelina sativa]|uniref:Cyclin-T1-5-like n=1 Tax=Camelina sativa TaxID=90675 RepID=A0ABM0UIU0_CAMSA|nr:PREDICTED: cyclin-T1-5-like [Camelina sativa]XP_010441766.1 PREDICTED: cyclin-T1-5-like [Camelina sativa]